MGFAREVLSGVQGIEWYTITGILLFVILFAIILYRTVKLPKKDLNDFKTSIFEPGELKEMPADHAQTK
ncbi:MAG: hypothetical protein LWW85_05040 [Marinilabiliales bacterium]|nr:hypothetical protein [Marinilabiliales bacterium]